MNFQTKPSRRTAENIIPMINVVFLLLIFFLMTSQIVPPNPFDVTLPSAPDQAKPTSEMRVYISQEGMIGFGDETGSRATALLGQVSDKDIILQVHADAQAKALKIAEILRELTQMGFGKVEFVVTK